VQTVYWSCLYGGIIFAVITVIFGDILGDVFDGIWNALSIDHLDFLSPMTVVGGITAFGGAGIMLERLTSLEAMIVAVFAMMIAAFLSTVVYFIYVKPMKNAENSSGYTMSELVGKIGTITVPIPEQGCGEVLIKIGGGNTNHIACSCDGEKFAAGVRVVVADIKDGTLQVIGYQDH
jgi:membrane protein implicated in regulation of membrane protease activity